MDKQLDVTLTQTFDRNPLATVRNLPGCDADLTPLPPLPPLPNYTQPIETPRLVPHTACKQRKCMNNSTGCWGECQLKREQAFGQAVIVTPNAK